jgi:hypothetical protein
LYNSLRESAEIPVPRISRETSLLLKMMAPLDAERRPSAYDVSRPHTTETTPPKPESHAMQSPPTTYSIFPNDIFIYRTEFVSGIMRVKLYVLASLLQIKRLNARRSRTVHSKTFLTAIDAYLG